MSIQDLLKIVTFFYILFIGLASSWASAWHLGPTMLSLLIILCAYVLLLILPITKFKLSASGFEGELERLVTESTPISVERAVEVDEQVNKFSENTVEPDLLLMRLSIEIETTLREISIKEGMTQSNFGIGQLVNYLRQKEIVTDPWLISALRFFQKHRNELVHEGKTDDIQNAIEIGRIVLARLKDINEKST